MELTPILGAIGVITAIGIFWWGLSAGPSPARGNLIAGIAESAPNGSPFIGAMRQIGQSSRRLIPNPLLDRLEVNLVQAGHPGGLDLPRLLSIKMLLGGAAAFFLILSGQLVVGILASIALFFLPDYWLLSVRDERQTQIQSDAADIIDQLTICVEAGLGFDAALGRVATTTEGPLNDELRHAMSDISAGVPRNQALRALSDRAQVPEIRQLVTALLQSQKHGVSIAETLRVQSAEMRLKRTQRTEERAAKLTVKMVFPIVICYLPVFLIITLVPSLISVFQAL